MKQGAYYDYEETAYHADPCEAPSLSAGIIKPLLNASPLHAWYSHPRLNPNHEREEKATYDFGKAAHSFILRDPKSFEVVDANDWRTKDAKERRDAAYASGKIPLLTEQYKDVQEMVESAHKQLALHECTDAFKADGKKEVTLIWQEGDVWCRCRVDYISANGKNFYDYKTTDQSANPEYTGRMMFNLGYDITSAFYKRGIRAVFGIDNPNYRFVIQEKSKPFCLSVNALDPMADAIADRKIYMAINLWDKCLKTNIWPGYPKRIAYVSMPSYMESAWLEREIKEEEAA